MIDFWRIFVGWLRIEVSPKMIKNQTGLKKLHFSPTHGSAPVTQAAQYVLKVDEVQLDFTGHFIFSLSACFYFLLIDFCNL